MPTIDWSDEVQIRQFEYDLEAHRNIKKKYTWPQWLLWFVGVIVFPASLVLAFYGPVAYKMVNDAEQEKKDQEEAMLLEWLEFKKENLTEDEEPPDFVYNEPLNMIRCNFYFLTVPCQGTAFLLAVAHHYTDYRKWSTLGKMIAALCLPVDVLIFYVEPLGFVGTLVAMVLGFVPFELTVADAMFPQKEVRIKSLKGKTSITQKNSWKRHFSTTYNERYKHVVNVLKAGFNFFATLALVIVLFKGVTRLFLCNLFCNLNIFFWQGIVNKYIMVS